MDNLRVVDGKVPSGKVRNPHCRLLSQCVRVRARTTCMGYAMSIQDVPKSSQ